MQPWAGITAVDLLLQWMEGSLIGQNGHLVLLHVVVVWPQEAEHVQILQQLMGERIVLES